MLLAKTKVKYFLPCVFVKCKFLFFLVNEGQFLNVCVLFVILTSTQILLLKITLSV